MKDAELEASLFRAVDELKETAGVCGGDGGCAGGLNVIELAFKELAGHLGLDQVIYSGTAAARGTLGQLNEPQVRYGLKELPGLCGDLLSVSEVTGFVVRDHLGRGVIRWWLEADGDQPFVDIAHLPVPGLSA